MRRHGTAPTPAIARLVRGYAVVLTLWVAALVALVWVCAGTLYSACYITGWVFLAIIGGRVLVRFRDPVLGGDALRVRAVHEVALTVVMLTLFAVHVQFRIPNGWVDAALTIVFVGVLASAAWGLTAVRRPVTTGEARLRRWSVVHALALTVLLSVAGFHGVFVHTHGLVASVLLQK